MRNKLIKYQARVYGDTFITNNIVRDYFVSAKDENTAREELIRDFNSRNRGFWEEIKYIELTPLRVK